MLPNFFIVGAPKAGTTSLYHYLDQHPQIYMSPIKEPCYFASELRPENYAEEIQPWITGQMASLRTYLDGPMTEKRFGGLISDLGDYQRLFRDAKGAHAIGEASVCYLWSPTAAQSIAAKIPDAKIVMILRNPVERAFSQYMHAVNLGATRRTFREQIEASLRERDRTFGKIYPFLEFGLYHAQVKRYLDRFPRERIKIYLYEKYREMLPDLFRFLDVDASFSPAQSQRRLQPRIPKYPSLSPRLNRFLPPFFFKPRESITTEDRAYLCRYYEEDITNLSTLLDYNLQSWIA